MYFHVRKFVFLTAYTKDTDMSLSVCYSCPNVTNILWFRKILKTFVLKANLILKIITTFLKLKATLIASNYTHEKQPATDSHDARAR